ncbi:MAG: double zinc ribbon domain-containing protein [Lachnospiraceae bacterium]
MLADQRNGGSRLQISTIKHRALDLLYPPRCPLCERIVKYSGTACPSCRGRLRVVAEPTCEVCGRPLQPGTGPYCEDCLQIEHHLTGACRRTATKVRLCARSIG